MVAHHEQEPGVAHQSAGGEGAGTILVVPVVGYDELGPSVASEGEPVDPRSHLGVTVIAHHDDPAGPRLPSGADRPVEDRHAEHPDQGLRWPPGPVVGREPAPTARMTAIRVAVSSRAVGAARSSRPPAMSRTGPTRRPVPPSSMWRRSETAGCGSPVPVRPVPAGWITLLPRIPSGSNPTGRWRPSGRWPRPGSPGNILRLVLGGSPLARGSPHEERPGSPPFGGVPGRRPTEGRQSSAWSSRPQTTSASRNAAISSGE